MTLQQLQSYITYNPDTGTVTKLKGRNTPIDGTTYLNIEGKNYSILKLIWFISYGDFPERDLLLLDGDKANLSLSNIFQVGSLNGTYITQELLKKYLDYNKDTGIFTWKLKATKNTTIGSRAGFVSGTLPDSGYRLLTIFDTTFAEHRLAWMYVHGTFPDKQLDHINHDRTDNRLINLREATQHINMKNKSLYTTNSSGYAGVEQHGSMWKARIGVNGTKVLLGVFASYEEAVAAKKAGEKLLNYHENHGLLKV